MKYLLILLLIASCREDKVNVEVDIPPRTEPHPFRSPPEKPALVLIKDPISIKLDRDYGGAITSLSYQGREFVNIDDHGREIQSAVSFDNLGECYNPTEAGRYGDTDKSTSVVLEAQVTPTSLHTLTDAAFWLWPGHFYWNLPCGTAKPTVYSAQNTTDTGGYLIEKTIDFPDIPNAIHFNLAWHVPNYHTSGTFEWTGYLLWEFDKFYTYDIGARNLKPLLADETVNIGEQPFPIIVSNGYYAMGVYARQYPGYGRWSFKSSRTNKWNAVWRESPVPKDRIVRHDAYLCVGLMEDVQKCLVSVSQ